MIPPDFYMPGIPRSIAEQPDMATVERIRDSIGEDNGQTLRSALLKPCPFCGGEAVRMGFLDHVDPHTGRGTRYVGCRRCCVASFTNVTDREAVEAWNRREGGRNASE